MEAGFPGAGSSFYVRQLERWSSKHSEAGLCPFFLNQTSPQVEDADPPFSLIPFQVCQL